MLRALFKFLILVLLLAGCKKSSVPELSQIDGNKLANEISKIINGVNSEINLNNLLTFIPPKGSRFNQVIIDSLSINNKKYYSVLLEHPVPAYNLFAILDSELNLYLKDLSLNGYLSSTWKKSGTRVFATVTENFYSKDSVLLKRINYYLLTDAGVFKCLRIFTDMEIGDKKWIQKISSLTDTAAYTEIKLADSEKTKSDKFNFSPSSIAYISDQNIFDTIVNDELSRISYVNSENEIKDDSSFIKITGTPMVYDAKNNSSGITNTFSITIDEDWKQIDEFTNTKYLEKSAKGIRLYNSKLGASLFILKLGNEDSIENYFSRPTTEIKVSNYNILSSDVILANKMIFQVIQFSCPSQKLLLLFDAPSATYTQHQEEYESIIKSFKPNC